MSLASAYKGPAALNMPACSFTMPPKNAINTHEPQSRLLSPEAQRALAEAEARRRQSAAETPAAEEVGGRDGPEPTRYGDWEKGGLVSDF